MGRGSAAYLTMEVEGLFSEQFLHGQAGWRGEQAVLLAGRLCLGCAPKTQASHVAVFWAGSSHNAQAEEG